MKWNAHLKNQQSLVTTRCAACRDPQSSLLTQSVSSLQPHYSLSTHRTEHKIIASAGSVASFSFSSSACPNSRASDKRFWRSPLLYTAADTCYRIPSFPFHTTPNFLPQTAFSMVCGQCYSFNLMVTVTSRKKHRKHYR